MRMVHRAGLLLPNDAYFVFKDGKINGITWTGSASGYGSYTISTYIMAGAYIQSGVTGSGSASVIATVDLRGFKRLHFRVSYIKVYAGTAPNIRVYPNYVSLQNSAPFDVAYDLSAITDL